MILELSNKPDLIEKAIKYFHDCWSNALTYAFFRNSIINSVNLDNPLPKFYLLLDHENIIGSYALLTNDFVSRQDFMPWFACLFVNQDHRNKGLAQRLLNHGIRETRLKGFEKLYLKTDLVNFYEKKGWVHLCNGYNVTGEEIKIYSKDTK